MAVLLYDKTYCKIFFHEDLQCVHLNWEGFATSEEFREACDFSLELLEQKQVSRMIADNTNSKAITPEDQKWLNEDWFGRAFAKGFRVSATIYSKNVFNKLALKNIVNNINGEVFTVQMFESFEDANVWIQSL